MWRFRSGRPRGTYERDHYLRDLIGYSPFPCYTEDSENTGRVAGCGKMNYCKCFHDDHSHAPHRKAGHELPLRCVLRRFHPPLLLSNTAALIMLTLSLKNRPKEVLDSGWLFAICLIAANLPVVVNRSGIDLTTGGDINTKARSDAAVLSVSATPVYFYAILSLGRNLTVLP